MSDKGDRSRKNRTRVSENSGHRVSVKQDLRRAAAQISEHGYDDEEMDFSHLENAPDFKRQPG